MAYFKIGETDLSSYTSGLEVQYIHNYTAQTNAARNTSIDYINRKRKVIAKIIALDDTTVQTILNTLANFSISIQILEPTTKTLETVNCRVENYNVSYYTIQETKKRFREFQLIFVEL